MINIDIFKGVNSIVLENEYVKAVFLPEYGSKMASLINKSTNFEFLFQHKGNKLELPTYGASFSNYDSSGFDEVFPSIDMCIYPDNGFKVPDHGEVWALKWDYEIDYCNEKISFMVKSPVFPYILKKNVFIHGKNIKFNYEVMNIGDSDFKFIWTPHMLLNCSEHTRIISPKELSKIINVEHSTEHLGEWGTIHDYPKTISFKHGGDIDMSRVEAVTANNCEKFYFINKLHKGFCGIKHEDSKEEILYQYPADKIPYLGVWKTQGGYRGHYNIALEPCTGVYDDLYVASHIKKVSSVEGKQSFYWWFNISIK